MPGPSSLNIEYIFAYLYALATGVNVDYSQTPFVVVSLLEGVAVFGVVISVILLIFVIYIRMRTHQIEHEGFHALEAALHQHPHESEVAPVVKNPRWEGVWLLMDSPNESDWRRAILEADIMLASLLKERGYVGESVGDQLKNANPLQFTTLDAAWEAHRMRNALAHLGEGFPLSERDARATIDQYKRVFEEFDYI